MLAAWALRRELTGLEVTELFRQLQAYDVAHLAIGVACTVGSFLALGVVERLALAYARRDEPVPARVAMTTAFVANAFSQSIGLAILTGGAVRLRAYTRYRLDGADVARVSGFVTLTVTIGLLATGAAAFLASSEPLRVWRWAVSMHPVGILLASIVLAYLAWSHLGSRDTIGRGAWELRRPTLPLAVRQVALASCDWLLTGTIFFALLPPSVEVGYGSALRIYLLAQTVGVISHVPGGAGVFELIVLALLAPLMAPEQRGAVVASLVVFRAIYYLLPLVAAAAVAAIAELRPAHRVDDLALDGD